jgi:hypothetical protein
MISNTDVTKQISDLMLDLLLQVDKSLAMVKVRASWSAIFDWSRLSVPSVPLW